MVDVAAAAIAEQRDDTPAEGITNLAFDEKREIGAVFGAADGIEVEGEGGEEPARLSAGIIEADDTDLCIDRPGRADRPRGVDLGPGAHRAILHEKPAVERDRRLLEDVPGCHRHLGRRPIGLLHCRHEPVNEPRHIGHAFGGSAGRLSPRDELKQFFGVVGAGVGVGGGETDVRTGDPRFTLDSLADDVGEIGGDHDQVAADDCRRAVPLAEHKRLGMERILRAGGEPLEVVAAHRIGAGGCDVGSGDAGPQRRLGSRQSRRSQRHPGQSRHDQRQHHPLHPTDIPATASHGCSPVWIPLLTRDAQPRTRAHKRSVLSPGCRSRGPGRGDCVHRRRRCSPTDLAAVTPPPRFAADRRRSFARSRRR